MTSTTASEATKVFQTPLGPVTLTKVQLWEVWGYGAHAASLGIYRSKALAQLVAAQAGDATQIMLSPRTAWRLEKRYWTLSAEEGFLEIATKDWRTSEHDDQ